MRISDWSSDVCSSDLATRQIGKRSSFMQTLVLGDQSGFSFEAIQLIRYFICAINHITDASAFANDLSYNIAFEGIAFPKWMGASGRSEEHTSELQSLMRI